MQYFEEAKKIWQTCVPKSGQSTTVEGELLRAVEKLRDEATRNGNANWDEGFEILADYLEAHLTDSAVFDSRVAARNQAVIDHLRDFEQPYLKDDLFDELGDRVVEYFRHYGSQSHAHNDDLQR